jgi:hypothetical protein
MSGVGIYGREKGALKESFEGDGNHVHNKGKAF